MRTKVENGNSFKMYFMHRPPGTFSIWVTLGTVTWFWSAYADKTGAPNEWRLSERRIDQPAKRTGNTTDRTLPIWSANGNETHWVEVRNI